MSFDCFRGETSITDLAQRLFNLKGVAESAVKQAEDALLKANPQLAEISKVPAGSIITIPDTAPVVASAQPVVAAVLLREFAAGRAQEMMTLSQKRLSDTSARAIAATSSMLAMAQSVDLQAAAEKDPDLKRVLEATVESANARLKLIQDLMKR